MSHTLATARQAFVASMSRDTKGAELARLVAVLDALIAWSASRPEALVFQKIDAANTVLRFGHTATGKVFWSARVRRDAAPRLEIYSSSGQPFTAEERSRMLEPLSTSTSEALSANGGLRIGFGALKNPATRNALLARLDELVKHEQPVRAESVGILS